VNFSNNNSFPIPDNNANGVSSPVVVSGINPSTILSTSLVQVTVNITHTYDANLVLYLVSPSGNQVILSKTRGGSGNNFTNTIFRMNAATAIGSGAAPFTGSFRPDGNFQCFHRKHQRYLAIACGRPGFQLKQAPSTHGRCV
jgi:hypothetical protein